MEKNELLYWLAIAYSKTLKLRRAKPLVMNWCIEQGEPLAALFDLTPHAIAAQFDLAAAEVEQLLEIGKTAPTYAPLVDKLAEEGIKILTRAEARYPYQWIQSLPLINQPLVLLYRGDFSILDEPTAAIVGERDVDEATQRYVRDLATGLANDGITIVSGYAPGVDRHAFDSALEIAEGCAVVILPQGFFTAQRTLQKWAPLIAGGQVAVFSPFHPATRPTEALAEARKQLITALAEMIFLSESANEQIGKSANGQMGKWASEGKKVFGRGATAEETLAQVRAALTDAGKIEERGAVYYEEDDELEDDDFDEADLPDVPLMDGETALRILEKGGNVPPALRARLQP